MDFSLEGKQPLIATGTNHSTSMISNPKSGLADEAETAHPFQLCAVASLRPKRRWKSNPPTARDVILEDAPSPTMGSQSRGPRLKRSGRPTQIWSTRPLNAHRGVTKLALHLNVQEIMGQIRDSLYVARFGHSH
jgi:hypothetical protein